jgi:hypothetical protein
MDELLPELREIIVRFLEKVAPYAISCRTAYEDVLRSGRLPAQRVPKQWLTVLAKTDEERVRLFLDQLVTDGIVSGQLYAEHPIYLNRPWYTPCVRVHYNACTDVMFRATVATPDVYDVFVSDVSGANARIKYSTRYFVSAVLDVRSWDRPLFTGWPEGTGTVHIDCTHCTGEQEKEKLPTRS